MSLPAPAFFPAPAVSPAPVMPVVPAVSAPPGLPSPLSLPASVFSPAPAVSPARAVPVVPGVSSPPGVSPAPLSLPTPAVSPAPVTPLGAAATDSLPARHARRGSPQRSPHATSQPLRRAMSRPHHRGVGPLPFSKSFTIEDDHNGGGSSQIQDVAGSDSGSHQASRSRLFLSAVEIPITRHSSTSIPSDKNIQT
jgi:hypothetical protein